MEISPVPGIRAVPAVQAKAAAFGLPVVFETEFLSRTGDETYPPTNGNPAGGDEDAFDEPQDEDKEEPVSDTRIWAIQDSLSHRIRLVV